MRISWFQLGLGNVSVPEYAQSEKIYATSVYTRAQQTH